MTTMDALDLARWTRFAARGGIGKCTAVQDCVAKAPEDLMFLKDDDIIVLMQYPDQEGLYLGYCEGVVGHFRGVYVRFHSKLKKAIFTKRSSVVTAKSPTPDSLYPVAGATTARSPPPPPAVSNSQPATSTHASPCSSSDASGQSGAMGSGRPHELSSANISPTSFSTVSSMEESGLTSSSSQSLTTPDSVHTMLSPVSTANIEGRRDHVPADLLDAPPDPKMARRTHNFAYDDSKIVDSAKNVLDPQDDSTSSSLPGLHERTYDYSERSHRISTASSDGELGIGLSLLQDLVNDADGEDWSSTEGDDPYTANPKTDLPASGSFTQESNGFCKSMALNSTSAVTEPRRRSPSSSISFPISNQLSQSDWEGASDIYDDYRYSRQSISSKMSRFSQSSVHTSNSSLKAPPLPTDSREYLERKQSIDSDSSNLISSSKPTGTFRASDSTRFDAVSSALNHSSTGRAERAEEQLHDFSLIHAGLALPETNLAHSQSISVPPKSPPASLSPTIPGAASALRQKFENVRGSPSTPMFLARQSTESKLDCRNIVIEDDEVAPIQNDPAVPDTSQGLEPLPSGSPSPEVSVAQLPGPLRIANRTPSPSPIAISSEKEGNEANDNSGLLYEPLSPLPAAAAAAAFPQTLQRQESSQNSPQPVTPAIQTELGPRRSLFLPHPNAPKPAPTPSLPMYIRRALEQRNHGTAPIPESNTIHIIRMVIAGTRSSLNATQALTIYGRCNKDLAESIGPVPITFSSEPLLVPAQAVNNMDDSTTVKSPATASTAVTSGGSAQKLGFASTSATPANTSSLREGYAVNPIPQSSASQPLQSTLVASAKPTPKHPAGSVDGAGSSNVIPRPNFVPNVQTTRPRSRSFSGFGTVSVLNTNLMGQHHEGVIKPLSSKTASSPFVPSPPKQRSGAPAKTSGTRGVHMPSPLSLPENNSVANRPRLNTLQSPLEPFSSRRPPASSLSNDGLSPQSVIRQEQSGAMLNEVYLSSSRHRPPVLKGTFVGTYETSPLPSSVSQRSFPISDAPIPSKTMTLDSIPVHTADDLNSLRISDTKSVASSVVPASSTPLGRTPSLRSKLSLPNLRGKNVGRIRQDDAWSIATSSQGQDMSSDNETVQVKDMDFELVRPIIPQLSSTRNSEDSLVTILHGSFDIKPDLTSVRRRADSPLSMSSGGGSSQRSPTVPEGPWNRITKLSDSETSMDAHRQRELKWVSVMSSVSSSQARKSKKVKKLLLDGVPSSVRFLVWAHLTDSKARGVPGVYSRLGQRVRISAYRDVRRDVQRCFADQPHLQVTHESLLSLLHTYLTMVPDIQYQRGLAFVAGHLLLLSPEEDAFWIFVSMMDTHLRPYFASNAIQVEVDALLFSKALEIHDPPLSKRIFFDLGVTATSICKPWFSCVFAETLPIEHLRRVWDLFLYEGLPFLFRVGLAVMSCCRRQLHHASNGDLLLHHLRHPPGHCFPPDPEAFLTLVFTVKLKDDDIRKQRVKMEAQVKRQTQFRMTPA